MDVEIDKQCCRTCLESTTANFLFDNTELVKKLEFTTSLKVTKNDGLPVYFCNPCHQRLEVAYQFRLQSIRSFKYLRNHIKQIQNQFESIVKQNNVQGTTEKQDPELLLTKTSTNFQSQIKEEDDDLAHLSTVIKNLDKANGNDPLLAKNQKSIKPVRSNKKQRTPKKRTDAKSFIENFKSDDLNSDTEKSEKNIVDVFNENDGVEFAKCDVCEKMFRKGNLKRHQQTHTGTRKFICEICNKSFTQKSSLQRHHRIHTGERPYACELCEKKFSQSKTLTFHMSTHGKDKTFNCSKCRYRFMKPEGLANHLREKHSDMKNTDEVILFVCQFCKKGFKSKYSLKTHKEKIHKGDIVFDMDWSDFNDEDSDDAQ